MSRMGEHFVLFTFLGILGAAVAELETHRVCKKYRHLPRVTTYQWESFWGKLEGDAIPVTIVLTKMYDKPFSFEANKAAIGRVLNKTDTRAHELLQMANAGILNNGWDHGMRQHSKKLVDEYSSILRGEVDDFHKKLHAENVNTELDFMKMSGYERIVWNYSVKAEQYNYIW